jgi:hypothetical protein
VSDEHSPPPRKLSKIGKDCTANNLSLNSTSTEPTAGYYALRPEASCLEGAAFSSLGSRRSSVFSVWAFLYLTFFFHPNNT